MISQIGEEFMYYLNKSLKGKNLLQGYGWKIFYIISLLLPVIEPYAFIRVWIFTYFII